MRHVPIVVAVCCLLSFASQSIARKADPVAELAPSTRYRQFGRPHRSSVLHALSGTGTICIVGFQPSPMDGRRSTGPYSNGNIFYIDNFAGVPVIRADFRFQIARCAKRVRGAVWTCARTHASRLWKQLEPGVPVHAVQRELAT
jgi:hypothetical protein